MQQFPLLKAGFAAIVFAAGILALGGSAYSGERATAIFAGGCFWCVESDFDPIDGVLETTSGYIGGTTENPTYKEVTRGGTGHYEAVKIVYDPSRVSYDELLTAFWHSVDPTDPGGQFCDRGPSYRTAIFATDQAQFQQATESKAGIAADLKAAIATPILNATAFYPAEDYHQDYYRKNPIRYRYYRFSCGRNARVERLWGKKAYSVIKDHKGS